MGYRVSKKCGDYIVKELFNPQKKMMVCSPYIDEHYALAILKQAKEGKLVQIITSRKYTGPFNFYNFIKLHAKGIRNVQCEAPHGDEFVHAKIFIRDNDFGVHGSCNLTTNGLHHRVNYVQICDSQEQVQELADAFDKIWNFNADMII